jgi:hypothetical protein
MRGSRYVLVVSAAIALAAGLGPLAAQSQLPRPTQLPPAGGPGSPGGGPGSPGGPGGAPQNGPGQAQTAPPKPYKPVSIKLPQASSDPSFEAFRKELGEIAGRKDKAALGKLVAAHFFIMGEQGDKADKKKSAMQNLAAAIDLEEADGAGWDALTAASQEPTLEPFDQGQHQGVMCAPASAGFDDKAFEQLLKTTGTDPFEWGYPNAPQVEVRGSDAAGAPVIDKLGTALVRILPETGDDSQAAPTSPPTMLRVVTPAGKTGYVAADAVQPLAVDQLCYVKEASGWKIAGYVGGE